MENFEADCSVFVCFRLIGFLFTTCSKFDIRFIQSAAQRTDPLSHTPKSRSDPPIFFLWDGNLLCLMDVFCFTYVAFGWITGICYAPPGACTNFGAFVSRLSRLPCVSSQLCRTAGSDFIQTHPPRGRACAVPKLCFRVLSGLVDPGNVRTQFARPLQIGSRLCPAAWSNGYFPMGLHVSWL